MNGRAYIQERVRFEAQAEEDRRCRLHDLERAIACLPRSLQPVAWMVGERWTEREMADVLHVSRATAHRIKLRVLELLARNLSQA